MSRPSAQATAALVLATLALGCDSGATDLETNAPVFDLDRFEQNIINRITVLDEPMGWAYTISVDGDLARSDAFGHARAPQDGGLDFTLDKEINVASVTKFYTAIGAMQLLEANGLTVDSLIAPWLPPRWLRGPGVDQLTFGDLLRHRSGLQSENRDFDNTLGYEALRFAIQTGVVLSKTRRYLNVNFALFRVLIPSLWSALPDAPAIDLDSDENTQFMYRLYMQQHVFDPLDLPGVDFFPEADGVETLYYAMSDRDDGSAGTEYGDWNYIAGGGGYYMSVLEMARVNAFWEHTNVLLSDDARQTMKDLRLGMEPSSSFEERGRYYSKIGGITNGRAQGVMTVTAIFPFNGVDAAVVINTGDVRVNDNNVFDSFDSLRDALYLAYNEAWQ